MSKNLKQQSIFYTESSEKSSFETVFQKRQVLLKKKCLASDWMNHLSITVYNWQCQTIRTSQEMIESIFSIEKISVLFFVLLSMKRYALVLITDARGASMPLFFNPSPGGPLPCMF